MRRNPLSQWSHKAALFLVGFWGVTAGMRGLAFGEWTAVEGVWFVVMFEGSWFVLARFLFHERCWGFLLVVSLEFVPWLEGVVFFAHFVIVVVRSYDRLDYFFRIVCISLEVYKATFTWFHLSASLVFQQAATQPTLAIFAPWHWQWYLLGIFFHNHHHRPFKFSLVYLH